MPGRKFLVVLASTLLLPRLSQSYWIPTRKPPFDQGFISERQDLNLTTANATEAQEPDKLACLANSGSSSCAHIGRDDICCPDILVISPLGASTESSCFNSASSTSGVLCCMDPLECERAEHHSEQAESMEVSCLKGYYECSSELGGSCCPVGYDCTTTGCIHNFESQGDAASQSGTFERSPSTTSGNFVQDPLCEPGTGIADCSTSPLTMRAMEQRPIKTKRVLKMAMTSISLQSKTDILKTGETEKCAGDQCEKDIQQSFGNPLDQLGAVEGDALTSTKAVHSTVTTQQLESAVPTTSDITGTVGDLVNSGAPAHVKHGDGLLKRTLNSHHIRYMTIFLVIQGIRWFPGRI